MILNKKSRHFILLQYILYCILVHFAIPFSVASPPLLPYLPIPIYILFLPLSFLFFSASYCFTSSTSYFFSPTPFNTRTPPNCFQSFKFSNRMTRIFLARLQLQDILCYCLCLLYFWKYSTNSCQEPPGNIFTFCTSSPCLGARRQ